MGSLAAIPRWTTILFLTLTLGWTTASTAACQRADRGATATVASADTSEVYTQTSPSRDGIGKVYMGREISQVMGHRGAAWLERPERASNERPDLVVDSMELAPTDVVADIGAGTGYFTFRMASQVPRGRVFAVDIQPEMLDMMRQRMEKEGVSNVSLVRGETTDPELPADSIDAALMVDAYHEFSHPREMMQNLVEALVPGGRVVLIEYRKEDPSVPIKPLHKMSEAQVRKEMEAVGLEWINTKDMLPQQHFLVFQKPTTNP
jgi:FkbM family methyltransferase